MRFCTDYLKHDARLYRHIQPSPLESPRLIALNQSLADRLGLDLTRDDWRDVISGRLLPLASISPHGLEPIAMAYAGHQFGQWAGQLGDGRGLLIAQLSDDDGGLIDLHLKGAGLTPYSRRGDGRAMLDSSIREYLAGHALNCLDIPSSDAIGLIISDTRIMRRHYEPAAALLRVSDCHVRLGHFEWVAAYAPDYFDQFINQIAQSYYPHLYDAKSQQADVPQLLTEISINTAKMIARWQLIGFSHGVMNTDNLNITGTTLDFGPYGFMEGFDPTWINNHSDHSGRYIYQNQPMIGHWNLVTVFRNFVKLTSLDAIENALDRYEQTLTRCYYQGLLTKIGLMAQDLSFDDLDDNFDPKNPETAEQLTLAFEFLELLKQHKLDYTNSFRSLMTVAANASKDINYTDNLSNIELVHAEKLSAHLDICLPYDQKTSWQNWQTRYHHAITKSGLDKHTVIKRLAAANPVYILRNHMAQKAIDRAHAGDFDEVNRLFDLLSKPYQFQPNATADDTRMALSDERLAVSCMS